jgi:hypothetical protein
MAQLRGRDEEYAVVAIDIATRDVVRKCQLVRGCGLLSVVYRKIDHN